MHAHNRSDRWKFGAIVKIENSDILDLEKKTLTNIMEKLQNSDNDFRAQTSTFYLRHFPLSALNWFWLMVNIWFFFGNAFIINFSNDFGWTFFAMCNFSDICVLSLCCRSGCFIVNFVMKLNDFFMCFIGKFSILIII